jgi:hypothetical protein
MVPVRRTPLRHHVRVRLEEQGPPRTIALPHGPHVRTAGCDFIYLHPEARVLQIIRDVPRDALLVAVPLFRTVDARDADELPREAYEFLAVDTIQYLFEYTSESGVCSRFDVRFRQLNPASPSPSSLLSQAVTSP